MNLPEHGGLTALQRATFRPLQRLDCFTRAFQGHERLALEFQEPGDRLGLSFSWCGCDQSFSDLQREMWLTLRQRKLSPYPGQASLGQGTWLLISWHHRCERCLGLLELAFKQVS